MNEQNTVAVFGLGIIGSRVANQLASKGQSVITWARSGKSCQGISSANSPEKAAAQARVLALYLKDGLAVRETLEAAASVILPDHVILNHSTVDLGTTRWIAEFAKSRGCQFLDAPFTGSKLAAQSGQLVYYIGGSAELLESMRPILEKSSKSIVFMGEIGSATIVKLVTNLVSATAVQALSEALAISTRHGIEPKLLIEAIASNFCGSPLAAFKLPCMADGNFETHFSLDNMRKDSVFALELAKEVGLEPPAIRVASEQMTALCLQGHAQEDYCALFRQFEK